MKLTYFSIRDYRSIAKAELENLGTSSILIGPNNEGKSNVLQALNACLTLLSSVQPVKSGDSLSLRYERESYDWSVDFPIKKQAIDQTGSSVFQLHFELSESEREAFETETGSTLNEVLPIELRFSSGAYASFKVQKPGKGGKALSKKAERICKFVSATLDFAYIPAVRTAEASLDVVNALVRRELRQLEKNPKYAELQKGLEDLQKPILEGLAKQLKQNLTNFLGTNLKDVTLTISGRYRHLGLGTTCKITIDDGTPTLLERKGDGVQSLVAISLMTETLQSKKSDKDIILLIEEPESHLHPKAIHQLREVLDTLRQDNQLIVTTHCPLLVNRANVSANLIVTQNQAAPAKSLAELRDVLGVRTSDNLQHAALVLVVEGPDDEIALRGLFSHYSEKLKEALSKGSLAFHVLGGASKLPYALSLLQSFVCNYFCFLDDDDEGRKAYIEANKALLASPANTTFSRCQGLPEAEFEDLLSESIYLEYFSSKYAVDVRYAPFDLKAKWSKRIRHGLKKSGKPSSTPEVWSEKDEYEDKRAIAMLVAKTPGTAIHPAKADVMRNLTSTIEDRLQALSAGAKI